MRLPAGAGDRVLEVDLVAAGPRRPATTATTSSRRSRCRSVSPTTSSRRPRCRIRAASRSRSKARPRTCRSAWTTSPRAPPRTSCCAPAVRVTACACVLRKRIPAGAGLGGGSADAAAALVAVRRLLELALDDDELHALALKLGSDVPFCLRGGAAWMRGRGERIEPVDLPSGLPFLVAIPPFRLPTPAVYATWDELGGPRATRAVPRAGTGQAAAPRAEQRPRTRRRGRRAAARRLPGRARGRRRPAGDPRRQRLGLRGARWTAAGACPTSRPRSGRRLRVPVVAAGTVTRGVRVG